MCIFLLGMLHGIFPCLRRHLFLFCYSCNISRRSGGWKVLHEKELPHRAVRARKMMP